MAINRTRTVTVIVAIAFTALWIPSIRNYVQSSVPGEYSQLFPPLPGIPFLAPADIPAILAAGDGRFGPSEIYRQGRLIQDPKRTSRSAALPAADPAVRRALDRARAFLGSALFDFDGGGGTGDEMGVPQLVRYAPGQQYGLHHDWLRAPRRALGGSPRSFNRAASFFAVLAAGCEGGETWFPFVRPPPRRGEEEEEEEDGGEDTARPLWRGHEDGGLAFRPVAGNALFWVNILPNGTGDTRTVHAGLPVTGGSKTAMNIWPRKYSADGEGIKA